MHGKGNHGYTTSPDLSIKDKQVKKLESLFLRILSEEVFVLKKAFNKLSKELDPKKNDDQDFFIEETKKLKEAYDKLMNSSILSSKRVKESKQNDNSQDNNKKSEKENTDPPTNEKSNFFNKY